MQKYSKESIRRMVALVADGYAAPAIGKKTGDGSDAALQALRRYCGGYREVRKALNSGLSIDQIADAAFDKPMPMFDQKPKANADVVKTSQVIGRLVGQLIEAASILDLERFKHLASYLSDEVAIYLSTYKQ